MHYKFILTQKKTMEEDIEFQFLFLLNIFFINTN